MARIVVGLDGSRAARRALAWAVGQARLLGATVEIVTACPYPDTVGPPGAEFPIEPMTEVEQRWREKQQEISREVIADGSDVERTSVVESGHAAELLLDRAHRADLLVVGTRGLGGFRGLLLGSVAQQCVTHARCPVVVVPAPSPDEDEA